MCSFFVVVVTEQQ